jgi:hypothetical protein
MAGKAGGGLTVAGKAGGGWQGWQDWQGWQGWQGCCAAAAPAEAAPRRVLFQWNSYNKATKQRTKAWGLAPNREPHEGLRCPMGLAGFRSEAVVRQLLLMRAEFGRNWQYFQ